MNILELRSQYHQEICEQILRFSKDEKKGVIFSNLADVGNSTSILVSVHLAEKLGCEKTFEKIQVQTIGEKFESITKSFIEKSFCLLGHIRPGKWIYSTIQTSITLFDQYEHLAYLDDIIKQNKVLSSAIGGNYLVKPDIIVARVPLSDQEINSEKEIVRSDNLAKYTPLRIRNNPDSRPILHASISCKWTIRSDRSQNTRTEALNLIRNRKGNLPHIMAVTAEPLPTRIATLALGTGDLDCVYHFALNELIESIRETGNEDQIEVLDMMIDGRRLRDISDLPFDLAV